ncbi:hypothetical protein F383_17128 [Gossypium arboreum]|uniref:Uncharacterized protein n=1 Tax=Gossypium arboreum TaxID=29729 RepID=A0A0B0MKI0_GOSAR|nr:hypothetical protein F383_17128 [Gossypium arboreum]
MSPGHVLHTAETHAHVDKK